MTNRLLIVLIAGVTAAGCDSSRPLLTFPTRSQAVPPTPTPPPSPPPNYQEKGPMPTGAVTIAAGQIVTGAVESEDPVCFPNWDSTGHCRQFEMTASIDGTLVATLMAQGPSRGIWDPDLFLVGPDESWIWAGDLRPGRRGSMSVSRGATYRLVVVAYGPFPDRFELAAEVNP